MLTEPVSRRAILGYCATGLASGAVGRFAAAADLTTSWKFGDVTVSKIVDMVGTSEVARTFPDAKIEAFDENADWLVPHFYDTAAKSLIFSYHAYLIRTARHVILVDGGYGNDKVRRNPDTNMRRGPFLENLRAAGVTPEQVNFVVNTHFHTDHIGWNARYVDGRWIPTFPNARYLFSRAELEYGERVMATTPASLAIYNDSLKPAIDAGLADSIDGDHDIGDGVRIVAAPGHKPGHRCLAIDSRGRRAFLSADIVHSPIEVRYPEWTLAFDDDKEGARAQRIKFVDAHTDVDVTIFAAHFGGPTAGKIVSDRGGKRWFRTLVA